MIFLFLINMMSLLLGQFIMTRHIIMFLESISGRVATYSKLHEKCRSVSQNQQNFILSYKIFYSVRQMSGRNYNDNV